MNAVLKTDVNKVFKYIGLLKYVFNISDTSQCVSIFILFDIYGALNEKRLSSQSQNEKQVVCLTKEM